MHESLVAYLQALEARGVAPATLKAARADLNQFIGWWEQTYQRPFLLTYLSDRDLRTWKGVRQRDDGVAPATINRALSTLRQWGAWAVSQQLVSTNPASSVDDVPHTPLAPRSLPDAAVDALLRAAHATRDPTVRLRDEALLALLVYAGLRSQEVCDVQLRDLDLAGGTVTVRSGKGGTARRVPLHPDAQRMLARYLHDLRCPMGLPPVGSDQERDALFVGVQATRKGHPLRLGLSTRLVRHRLAALGRLAATHLRADALREPALERRAELGLVAQQLDHVSPHMLRHSLARRLLDRGTTLVAIQRILGHSRLSTTGIYLTPSEEELRVAIGTTGL